MKNAAVKALRYTLAYMLVTALGFGLWGICHALAIVTFG